MTSKAGTGRPQGTAGGGPKAMNSLHLTVLVAMTLLLFPTTGCDHHGSRSRFDLQLTAAEEHAKVGTLSETEIRQVHSYIIDRQAVDEERHRQIESVIRAIVDSESMIWLQEFCQLNLDGEFGHYQPTVVWRFGTKCPEVFFASPMANNNFRDQQLNPEQAFNSRRNVQDSISILEAFAARSGEAKRHRAEAWAAVLKGMLKEYPQIIKTE